MTRLEVFSLANAKLKDDKSKQQVFDELCEETGWSERRVLSVIRHIPSFKLREKYQGKRYWSMLLLLIVVGMEMYRCWTGELMLSTFWLIFASVLVLFHLIGMYAFNSIFHLSAGIFSGIIGYRLLQNIGFSRFDPLDYSEFVVCIFLFIAGLTMRGRLMDKYTMTKVEETDEDNVLKPVYKVVFEE